MFIDEEKIRYGQGALSRVDFLRVKHCPPHYHAESLELVYCLRGAIRLKSGFEEIRLEAGDYFTINHHEIHYFDGDGDGDDLVMLAHFDLPAFNIITESLLSIIFVFENHRESCGDELYRASRLKALDILMLTGLLHSEQSGDVEVLNRLAALLLDIFMRDFTYINYARKKGSVPPATREIFYEMSRYVDEHSAEKISITSFADEFHFSKRYLANIIKSNTDLTFNKMLNFFRCEKAEFALLTGSGPSDPIEDISRDCGFSDLKYFYRTFKLWYGRTPAQHREFYENVCRLPRDCGVLDRKSAEETMRNAFCLYFRQRELERLL